MTVEEHFCVMCFEPTTEDTYCNWCYFYLKRAHEKPQGGSEIAVVLQRLRDEDPTSE